MSLCVSFPRGGIIPVPLDNITIKLFTMAGRGDNNQHGSAGRGASNQSNQGSREDGDQQKANHNRNQTAAKRSQPSPKTADQDANRNQGLKDSKQTADD